MASFNNGILFYHEAAGQGDVNTILGGVTANLVQMCQQFTIYKSAEEGDIIKYCHRIKEEHIPCDVLFILGGDGTVHELINGVLEAELNLPIGVLPGGTFNDFTKTLNLAPEPVAASAQLLEAKVKYIDVMQTGERYVLNFIGLGLIVENSEGVVAETKSKLGKFSYLFSTLKTVTNPTFFNYKVTVDDETFTGESSMIVIANGNFVGGNHIPLAELSPDDGKINVFIFKDAGIKLFTELLSEKNVHNWNELSSNIEHHEGTKMKIETTAPMKVDVDGEIDLETPIEAMVLTKRLRMFAIDAQ